MNTFSSIRLSGQVLTNGLSNLIFGGTGIAWTGDYTLNSQTGRFYSIENINDYCNSGNLFSTGSNLLINDTVLSGKIISLSGGAVLAYGSQQIAGIKTFQNNVLITGNLSQGDASSNTFLSTNSFAQGSNHTIWDRYSFAQGYGNTVSGFAAHGQGVSNSAIGDYSHVEGVTNETIGTYSHAEGVGNIANGAYSHAEGASNVANGDYSHVEGFQNTSEGAASHAEGYFTQSIGNYSHAEGFESISYSNFSHTEGINTIATGEGQLAVGRFNSVNNNPLFIIGNGGEADYRSNVVEIYNSGVKIGSGNRIDFDSSVRSLSGQWQTNTLAAQSGDIVNKYYLDQRTGLILDSTVVRTTGAQTIEGIKSFTNGILSETVSSIVGDNVVDIGAGTLLNGSSFSNLALNWETRTLYDSNVAIVCDWQNKQLSGIWSTNTVPVDSGHLINKYYLDQQTGSLYPNYNPSNFSTSGNLYQTGANLFTNDTIISGNITSLSGDVLVASANLTNTGITLLGADASLQNQISNTSKISVTGSAAISGQINITGLGSVTTTLLNQTIYISGADSAGGSTVSGVSGVFTNNSGNYISISPDFSFDQFILYQRVFGGN